MRTKLLSFILLLSIMLAGCAVPTAPAAQVVIQTQPAQVVIQTQPAQVVIQTQPAQVVVQTQVVQVTPTPGANPEAVIPNVEANAQITVWTFWLSPTFDAYIKDTIARFQQTYPGVTVKWEDHQATFQDDLKNALAAGTAPDVVNLSVAEGWVSDFAVQGKLLALDDKVSQAVKDLYFPGLWKMQLVKGVNYQFPYYQGMSVEVINTQILNEKNGFKLADFPKTVDGLPALCKAIKEKTGKLCDIRLTTNDLLSQMVYEGNVKVISDDGKSFTFNSKEAVDWLNLYVGMVKDGSVDKNALVTDQDRVGLDLFNSGQAPFYATGPNLIRDIRSNNPGLYGYLATVPAPLGKSGVLGKGLMGMSVNAATKYPNAAIALAQFMTNPKSMVEFSKLVAVYPGTPSSYADPFFSQPSAAIEDSAKQLAKDTVAKYADILPTIPNKAKVNDVLLKHIQQALFNGVEAQKALDAALAEANALIK